jgi:TM2 domain-containing membrane protein YozV
MSTTTQPAVPATTTPPVEEQPLVIDLRDPYFAGLLAWLIPGAGHFYQRRYAKGILFLVCILGTFFFGFILGGQKVVYAAWNKSDKRWQFIPQVAVGLPAAPAIVQGLIVRRGGEPILWGFMAPPREPFLADGVEHNELADWHNRLNIRFEIGTLYTMIAGLLNILAIWDAACGPVITEPSKKERAPPGDEPKPDGG